MNFIPFLQQWKLIVAVLTPLLCMPVLCFWQGHTGKEPYAAFVILVMAVYWMSECVPLAVASFIPVILFPVFGILSSDKVSSVYLQDSILFLLGGVVIALAVEYSNLHTRIATKVILVIGANISRLLLGCMLVTTTLSMWMNNTSTTAMMVPIVNAIMEQLRTQMHILSKSTEIFADKGTSLHHAEEVVEEEMELKSTKTVVDTDNMVLSVQVKTERLILTEQINERIRNLKVMFLLATAYSSNIGGTAVITGSATNVIVLDLVRKDADQPYCPEECRNVLQIGFLDWMVFNVPPMALNTIFCWLYLQLHFIGIPVTWKFWASEKEKTVYKAMTKMDTALEKSVAKAIRQKYDELGKLTFHEIGVFIILIITTFLWIFKDPQFIKGWDSLFPKTATGKSLIKEATPTLLMCLFLFAVPRKAAYFKDFVQGGLRNGMNDPLLSWKFVMDKFPWGLFILLGGGSAMASGARASGLNKLIEEVLESSYTLQVLPAFVLFILILCMTCILTTLASNTACAAIITPVLLGLSYVRELHPLYMVLATGSACSYAFMLPVSTPPNAIVYSSSVEVKMGDFIKVGFFVNLICIFALFLTTHTTSNWFFDFDGYNNECKNMSIS